MKSLLPLKSMGEVFSELQLMKVTTPIKEKKCVFSSYKLEHSCAIDNLPYLGLNLYGRGRDKTRVVSAVKN